MRTCRHQRDEKKKQKPGAEPSAAVSYQDYTRVDQDFTRLLFLHAHREASILTGELPEESEQVRFFRTSSLPNLKDSVGLIMFEPLECGLLFPSICLRSLSCLYLAFLTLVGCLLFLINLWS
jgi:hypothetical protein